jgi:hypothetical protein
MKQEKENQLQHLIAHVQFVLVDQMGCIVKVATTIA